MDKYHKIELSHEEVEGLVLKHLMVSNTYIPTFDLIVVNFRTSYGMNKNEGKKTACTVHWKE